MISVISADSLVSTSLLYPSHSHNVSQHCFSLSLLRVNVARNHSQALPIRSSVEHLSPTPPPLYGLPVSSTLSRVCCRLSPSLSPSPSSSSSSTASYPTPAPTIPLAGPAPEAYACPFAPSLPRPSSALTRSGSVSLTKSTTLSVRVAGGASCPCRPMFASCLCARVRVRVTTYTGNPDAMNSEARSASSGAEKMGIERRKAATQQKVIGVARYVRYGLYNAAMRARQPCWVLQRQHGQGQWDGPGKIRLAMPQDEQAQHGQEVEQPCAKAEKGDEGREVAKGNHEVGEACLQDLRVQAWSAS